MTLFAAIELLAGLALIAFGVCQALEGDAPAGQGGRGWFRASARENLVLGLVDIVVGICLLLHGAGVL